MSWVLLIIFCFPWTQKNKCLVRDFFFLLQVKTKVLCRAAMEVEAGAKSSLWNPCSGGRRGEWRLCHTPSRAKTTGIQGASRCYFEIVWGFLLCQKSCRGGNWRCIVETSIGAQEMTSLQELMITVRKFTLDFSFQVLWGMPQAWIRCLFWALLCIQVHLIVFFPH